MLELLSYLRANGFKTYIVTGGGVEFVRPWAEKTYGVPPEQVIASSIKRSSNSTMESLSSCVYPMSTSLTTVPGNRWE